MTTHDAQQMADAYGDPLLAVDTGEPDTPFVWAALPGWTRCTDGCNNGVVYEEGSPADPSTGWQGEAPSEHPCGCRGGWVQTAARTAELPLDVADVLAQSVLGFVLVLGNLWVWSAVLGGGVA